MENRIKYHTTSTASNEANITTTKLSRRAKAYSKVIQGFMQMAAGLYELVTDEKAPRPSDVLRGG